MSIQVIGKGYLRKTMGKIIIKTGERRTTVSRAAIRGAVTEVYGAATHPESAPKQAPAKAARPLSQPESKTVPVAKS